MMNKLIIPLLSVSLLTSCIAVHQGTINPTSSGRPVQYVDVAYGVAQTNKVLCLGGVSQDALVLEAKRGLVKNRPLQQNEDYANYTLDFKNTFFPFYWQTRVTLTADVIKYMNDTLHEVYTENYKNKLLPKEYKIAEELFHVGDTIINMKNEKGVILSFVNSNKVRILYKTANDKIRTQKVSIYDIYTTKKNYREMKIGELFFYNSIAYGKDEIARGKIHAFGLKELLIINSSMFIKERYSENKK